MVGADAMAATKFQSSTGSSAGRAPFSTSNLRLACFCGGASEGGGGIDGGTGSNGIEGGELAECGADVIAAGPAAHLQSMSALGVPPPLGTGAPAAITPSKCLASPAEVAATCAAVVIIAL